MARRSAINAVAAAGVAILNVSAFRTLCPGGVYREPRPAQSPPYTVVGPCSERPSDTFGAANLGSIVMMPVAVAWATGDDDGEARAVTILDAALGLLEISPPTLSVPGWTVLLVRWVGTGPGRLEYIDGTWSEATVATLEISVRVT